MTSSSETITHTDQRVSSAVASHTLEKPTVEIIHPRSISGPILDRWHQLRSQSPAVFDSPYFDPEFTKAVARVRDDVRIAIAEVDDRVVGILPFQEVRPGHAVPVGGLLNDWHGILGKRSGEILEQMLKAANLKSFKFHAMDNSEGLPKKYVFNEYKAHHLDLSEGWDAYRKWVFKHSSTVKRQGQKTRAMEREIGKVRFELDCDCPMLLEKIIELKRSKYQNSNTFDILGVQWASDLLRELHQVREPNFRGLLSILWAGDEFIGGHIGLLTNDVLHYWFPVYDPQYHKYSPGTQMLMYSAEEACNLGIRKLDLGYGDDSYKFKFCNASEPVAFGLANFSPASRMLQYQRYRLRRQLKQIPMKPYAKRVLRKVFPQFGGWNFR